MGKYNREAILIYLRNLRTLEFYRNALIERRKAIANRKYLLENEARKLQDDYDELEEPSVLNYKGDAILKLLKTIAKNIPAIALCYFSLLPNYNKGEINEGGLITGIVVGIGTVIWSLGDLGELLTDLRLDRESKSTYGSRVQEYNSRRSGMEQIMMKKTGELNEFEKEYPVMVNEIETDLRRTEQELKDAYSLNVIPNSYRNIGGVYYLYDYMSSCQDSLENAFMHLDLNEIKGKIEQVIENQGKILMKMESINQNVFDQNNQVLMMLEQNAESLEKNHAYAQMIETNTAVSLEMQREQTYYQKRTFYNL